MFRSFAENSSSNTGIARESRKSGRRAGPATAAASVAAAAALVLTAAPANAAATANAVTTVTKSAVTEATAPNADAALDVVMLVDESGSETDANVTAERQTAGTIAQAMLNPHSRVTVIGFGGVNHVAPDQDPVSVVCQPTIASGTANLAYLASCVNGLHRRTEAEGDDTDYAAALGQAMSYFSPATAYGQQSPAGAIKVVLMMTDGGLDVHRDTQQYGTDWLAGVHHAVDLQLAAARQDHVQVWPLGFGTIDPTDSQYLDYLAASGYQSACDNRAQSRPRAQIVQDPANALAALDSLYASAACLGSSSASGTIGGGTLSRNLTVSIPAFASDAVISVDRGNPAVQVNFAEPDGRLWTDPAAISGTGTAIEVLHLTDPPPGQWRIELTAPPGMSSELVRATVFWQGAVNALITAVPSSAQPGQPIGITLSILGWNGPITDPAELAQMQVGVSVSGDSLSGPTEIPVSNAGESTGTPTGSGDYKGTFTAPRATGTLTFTGTAAGYGLYATHVPTTVQVGTTAGTLQAAVQLPLAATVQAGQSLTGTVVFSNGTGAAHQVRLLLNVSHADATITPPGAIDVPQGSPSASSFGISFPASSPLGPAWVQVEVVDAGNPAVVYGAETRQLTVTSPPGILASYGWPAAIALLVLIAIAVAIWAWRRARRDGRSARGLQVQVRRGDYPPMPPLKAPDRAERDFRFVIRDGDRPDRPQPDSQEVYVVRRAKRPGYVTVKLPGGDTKGDTKKDVMIDGTGLKITEELRLMVTDARRRGSGAQQPPVSTTGTSPPPAAQHPGQPDPWFN
jgi:hypothetical protein